MIRMLNLLFSCSSKSLRSRRWAILSLANSSSRMRYLTRNFVSDDMFWLNPVGECSGADDFCDCCGALIRFRSSTSTYSTAPSEFWIFDVTKLSQQMVRRNKTTFGCIDIFKDWPENLIGINYKLNIAVILLSHTCPESILDLYCTHFIAKFMNFKSECYGEIVLSFGCFRW